VGWYCGPVPDKTCEPARQHPMTSLVPADLRADLRRGLFRRTEGWATSILLLAVTTVLVVVLKPVLDGEVSSGLIFVFGITLIGASAGLVPAFVSAVAASLVYNFFIADPILTFRMTTGDDLAPPIIFTSCAVISGLLAGRLRDKTSQLGQSNLQLESLLETSRHLQEAADEEQVFAALRSTVPARLGVDLALYRPGQAGPVAIGQSVREAAWLDSAQLALERGADVIEHGGLNSYLLPGSRGVAGVLVSNEPSTTSLDRAFMLALAQVVGLALERARFAAVAAEAEAKARTEELKSALLSSVSHDLRTPLTTISASASSLIDYGSRLDDETSRSLLHGIVDECERLNRFTANLLELSRLQSRSEALVGQVLSATDVARSVVKRTRARSPGREIALRAPREDVLVVADAALFELAITNILQNALLYSGSDTPVRIEIAQTEGACTLTVSDQGCGIPVEDQPMVFERFYRVKRSEPSPQGSGLGLAIAKGFVEAFDGEITLRSPISGERGTEVTIRLPLVTEAQP
jgi:two-component system, OmpR family, sensor histidine kinase KdpD